MGKRVNIQYSVEIDDLQDEINRLFGNAILELDKVQPVGGAPVAKLGTDGLEKVEQIRHMKYECPRSYEADHNIN